MWGWVTGPKVTEGEPVIFPECASPITEQDYLGLAQKLEKEVLEMEKAGESEGQNQY
jgi:hypothetical protein